MARHHKFLPFVFTFAIFSFGLFIWAVNRVDDEIRIVYPTFFLKPSPEILDPNNTSLIWEYYLLENLSCGLVRDDASSSTGYSGCIAERFFQEDSNTWVFKLKKLKWSDGNDVLSKEILDWIESLRIKSSRHIQYLKSIDHFEFNDQDRILRLHFRFDVNDRILHELSLVDAGLFPQYKKYGWRKTIGPYRVSKWVDPSQPLELEANPYSPIYSPQMPQKASLFWLPRVEDRLHLFEQIKVDVAFATSVSNRSVVQKMREHSSQEYVAQPTSIMFFHFNHSNDLTRRIENRESFANIILDFQRKSAFELQTNYGFSVENQMIPRGFEGRLSNDSAIACTDRKTLPPEITIYLTDPFKDLPIFLNGLKQAFASHGVQIHFRFESENESGPKIFAYLYQFVGNQLDPSGSWSFLLSPPNGVMSDWIGYVQEEYNRSFAFKQPKENLSDFEQLHSRVLSDFIAIPVMIGSIRYFFSSRIDAKNWNRFDSRMRIYALRWK